MNFSSHLISEILQFMNVQERKFVRSWVFESCGQITLAIPVLYVHPLLLFMFLIKQRLHKRDKAFKCT